MVNNNPVFVSQELIKRIREHVNRPPKQDNLLTNRKKWGQLTASLDILEDTICAVNYYFETDFPEEIGGQYLFIHGLLQVLFLQQDSINGLSESLLNKTVNFKKEYPAAYEVRELRNDVTGHPTNRGKKNNEKFIYLSRFTLTKNKFRYLISDANKKEENFNDSDILQAVTDTSICINSILNNIINVLDMEFRKYIITYRGQKMEKFFDGLLYAKGKILEDAHLKEDQYYATKRMVEKCKERLIKQYGSTDLAGSFSECLQKIDTAYDLIDNYLSEFCDETFNKFESCLLEYLLDRLEDLHKLCIAEDKYFESIIQ